MYKIVFTKEAAKYYKKCDEKAKRLLNESFKKLKENPHYDANIKRLHGELSGLFRYRAGSLRVVYSISENEVIVIIVAIGSRGDIYK
ncbi:MAG: type II toxin-antitoxin system RelE/ParE family toxin [Clostridiales bacterium]|nr:type II toxin-antitoxin system RelE/ParE family toxin [Clostridiales bacterium]